MLDFSKRDALIQEMVDEPDGWWLCEPKLLIDNGMNLQSMDTGLAEFFLAKLGPMTDDEILDAIALFHWKVLEKLGLLASIHAAHPDDLRLPVLHRPQPYRGEGKHGSMIHELPKAEIDEIYEAFCNERPDVVRHIELDVQDWIQNGRPKEPRHGKKQMAGAAVSDFILKIRPDLDSIDAGYNSNDIFIRIKEPYF